MNPNRAITKWHTQAATYEPAIDAFFLEHLEGIVIMGRKVSRAPCSIHYAPKVFAGGTIGRLYITRQMWEASMYRLLASGQIRVEKIRDRWRHWREGLAVAAPNPQLTH